MAYTSGTAASPAALATAVNTFLSANGWTINRTSGGTILEVQRTYTEGGNTYTCGMSLLHGTGAYTQWATGSYAFYGLPWTSWDMGVNFALQPGIPYSADLAQPFGCAAPMPSTNIPYHLFTDATNDNVVAVVGNGAGIYNYVGWGCTPDKFGTWSGSQYVFGTRSAHQPWTTSGGQDYCGTALPSMPPGYVDAQNGYPVGLCIVDQGGIGREWRGVSPTTAGTNKRTTRVLSGWSGSNNIDLGANNVLTSQGGLPNMLHLWSRARSSLAQNIILLPCVWALYNSTTTRWMPLLRLPLVRACMTYGVLTEGSQFTDGADTYRAFNSFAVQEVP